MRQGRADDALVRGQHDRERLGPSFVVGGIVNRDAYGYTGSVDDDVEPAETLSNVVDDSVDAVTLSDVKPPRFGTAADCRDFINDRFRAVGAEVGHRDIGAFLTKQARSRAAHAARRTCDEHSQTGNRA